MNHFEIEEYDGKNWHTRFSIAPNTGNIGIGTESPSEKLHVVGKIIATGGLVQSSDKRLKEDVQNIKNSLEKISAINGVSFKWLDKNRGEKTEIGVIAQDVEKVFPEVVVTDANGYKAVDYAKMIAPLIEAVKTLKSENELLKNQVMELTERVNEIEGE